MKRLVIGIGVFCFLSMSSLGQAAEIVRTPLSLEACSNLMVKEDQLLMKVNPDEIQAKGAGRVIGTIAIIAGCALVGALLAHSLSQSSNDESY